MKLNPPASSSDLETARQIARRLHQSRRREDRGAAWSPDEEPARPRLTPPPLPPRPAPPAEWSAPPARVEPAVARPAPAPEPLREPPPAPVPHPTAPPPPEIEAESELPDVAVESDSADPSFDLPEAPPFERPAWREPEPEAASEPSPEPEPAPLDDLPEPPFEPEQADGDVDIDVDEPALSPEEMIGGAAEADSSPLDELTDSEPSPFDDALLDAPAAAEEPAAPSWDDIVEVCRDLAQAKGAMLVDPAGQVFAARGDWPAPGPDAIATKLVSMMAKTLKDAPTRSISAPLMGMHLTAWRVQSSEGLVTAAFIGAAPVRAEARPAIDAEILSGVGS